MNATRKPRRALILTALISGTVASVWVETAAAQMFREPFSFQGRNRASMAVYMHQQGNSSNGTAAFAAGESQSTTLLCAGNGETSSTAAGNIMCIVAGDGTNVVVHGEQTSDGNQTSNAETNQTAADEIGEILNGETNG